MKAIAAVDRNWAIGNKGELLVSIPNDQKNFRNLTMDGTVILGRKTLQTFPGGKPLRGRRNIILTKQAGFSVEGAEIAHSIEEALQLCGYDAENTDDVWVIGGESIYRAFLPYCSEAVITKIEYGYEADAYFPDLDADPAWTVSEESEEMTCFDIEYRFVTYKRI